MFEVRASIIVPPRFDKCMCIPRIDFQFSYIDLDYVFPDRDLHILSTTEV